MGRAARSTIGVVVAALTVAQCGGGLTGDLVAPVDAARGAALGVDADGCGPRIGLGGGAMIDEHLAVTAAHVVAGSDRIEVHDTGGRTALADVVSFDPDQDIAVLRVAESVGIPIEIREDDVEADELGVIAVPERDAEPFDAEIVDGRVLQTVTIRTTDIYLDEPVERAGFEMEATVDPGDSGSLVVLAGGAAGIVWARSNQREGRAWAVELPAELSDPAVRRSLSDAATSAVDVGACTR